MVKKPPTSRARARVWKSDIRGHCELPADVAARLDGMSYRQLVDHLEHPDNAADKRAVTEWLLADLEAYGRRMDERRTSARLAALEDERRRER